MDINGRLAVKDAAKERAKLMCFGDKITNVCAGDGNPQRHAYFCQMITKSRKNRFGMVSKEYLVKCTDGKGKFWSTDASVIYPGHLHDDEAKELFNPIWKAFYG